ncbi:MAG: DNA methyltransferase [Thermodesulfovibrionales bacterium]|nr:DNA methyltransferase [Thermodesulfovibrionales bacterium]
MNQQAQLLHTSIVNEVFGKDLLLLSSVNELFELELALIESRSLPRQELLSRSAFFKSVDGNLTNHYKICRPFDGHISEDRSAQTQAYFQEGKYATGYATHGLFPYRGKFHPQLIKGLLNILEIKRGDIVLDPMCGSGTLNVEASLLGIDSIGMDVSPFCRLLAKVKCESLSLTPEYVEAMSNNPDKWFNYFSSGNVYDKLRKIRESEKLKIYELALLAYLDAMGYARRVTRAGHKELFDKVLNRYQATVLQTITNSVIKSSQLGTANILEGDARCLPLDDSSIDCIITSPPYSFAIDYAENDAPQLAFLGYNVDELRTKMIGLAGRTKQQKLQRYFDDMKTVAQEIVRVLKSRKFAIIIIGSNTNQTGEIRLEQTIIDHFDSFNASLVKSILKPIKGMRNTMKDEYILIFQKN